MTIFDSNQRICSLHITQSTLHSYYYHSDHLGSSSVITDASGQQVSHYEYTPYGTTATIEGTDTAKHKFTGKELDSTGLYFYGARYYDPEIGRFISADTIVQAPYDPQSLNRYSYCRNNPINYVDPSGHFFWFVIAAIAISATIGGVSAAINGGSIGMGIFMGALGGVLVGAGGVAASALWGPAWAFVGASVGGAASGAANAAVFGGNIGYGALTGAIGAGVGCGVGYGVGKVAGLFWGAIAGGLSGGVAGGGVGAGLGGGNFWQGAGMGAAYGVAGAVAGYTAVKVSGMQRPVGEKGKGSATNSLNTNKSESVSQGQALSRKGGGIRIDFVDAEGNVVDADPGGSFPPNRGFAGNPERLTLQQGTVVDRIGPPTGEFLSPAGTPFSARSLPPAYATRPIHTYQVLKAFEVYGGLAAPAFNQTGFGMQYDLGKGQNIQSLIDRGYLKELP